ncbi:hypothetical protein BA896_023460 [Janthinobacterium lividum]|uniref:Peptidase C39 domain-containing protein n=1 Tax=Janthinobacterium lividum TaxID=29581 RepID=A0A1E8PLN8_9BURK|nr:hypothetical protein BA896_023460 [Janthinobacterium lividum]
MRTRFSVSMKGMTLKGMINMAQGLSLNTRPLKLDMEHLHDLKLPCILHWDLNHFVVLKSLNVNYAHVHDPAVGERKITLKEFAKHFTGIALEISPGSDFRKKKMYKNFHYYH